MTVVSVIMPIRNEADFIERSLGRVLSQDYPAEKVEVIVVDGSSDDGTQALVEGSFQSHGSGFATLALVENPERIVPISLNLGLRRASGDVIIRVDGHCEVPKDYISRCIALLAEVDADCVGGRLRTVGTTRAAQAIAQAQSSVFGVGGVGFRTSSTSGYVDTLAFGAYRKDVFERIGTFDEELVRNQDDEFNFRLLQAGGRIWLDASIVSTYHSRASLSALWRQYFEYGLYKVRVMQKRRGVASIRHLVPAAFVLALLAAIGSSAILRDLRPFLIVAVPYAAADLVASLVASRTKPANFPLVAVAFLSLHLSYGAGFLAGLWRWRKAGRIKVAT